MLLGSQVFSPQSSISFVTNLLKALRWMLGLCLLGYKLVFYFFFSIFLYLECAYHEFSVSITFLFTREVLLLIYFTDSTSFNPRGMKKPHRHSSSALTSLLITIPTYTTPCQTSHPDMLIDTQYNSTSRQQSQSSLTAKIKKSLLLPFPFYVMRT